MFIITSEHVYFCLFTLLVFTSKKSIVIKCYVDYNFRTQNVYYESSFKSLHVVNATD